MYRTVLSRSMYHTILTILTESADVSTTKFIFASYFSRPISLENSRNTLIRFRTVHFLLCDDIVCSTLFPNRNLPRLVHTSKIVLYSIYVIMYVHGNSIGTDNQTSRPDQTGPDTLKSFNTLDPTH